MCEGTRREEAGCRCGETPLASHGLPAAGDPSAEGALPRGPGLLSPRPWNCRTHPRGTGSQPSLCPFLPKGNFAGRTQLEAVFSNSHGLAGFEQPSFIQHLRWAPWKGFHRFPSKLAIFICSLIDPYRTQSLEN